MENNHFAGLYNGELMKFTHFWKIGTFNWKKTVAKGQNMAILIIGQGNLEFHAFHDFQLHIHGLAVKLKNNNHLQENLRFARICVILGHLIRTLQWRAYNLTSLKGFDGEFEKQTKLDPYTYARSFIFYLDSSPSRGG